MIESSKQKLLIEIVIPHIKQNDFVSVLYSPFHRWEHLYIKLIDFIFCDCEEVFGECTLDATKISIIIKENNANKFEKLKIKHVLKNAHLSHRKILREVSIINNELSFLKLLFGKKMARCELGQYLSIKDMMFFRKKYYDWENITCTSQIVTTSIIEKSTSSNTPWLNYEQFLMKLFESMKRKSAYANGIIKIENKNTFVFYKIPIKKDDDRNYVALNLFGEQFFRRIMNHHLAITNILISSIDKDDTNQWISLMCFVNQKHMQYILEHFCESITKKLEADTTYKDYFYSMEEMIRKTTKYFL